MGATSELNRYREPSSENYVVLYHMEEDTMNGIIYIVGLVVVIGLIPDLIDQNPCAHWRNPMDMIFQGRSTRVFQA